MSYKNNEHEKHPSMGGPMPSSSVVARGPLPASYYSNVKATGGRSGYAEGSPIHNAWSELGRPKYSNGKTTWFKHKGTQEVLKKYGVNSRDV